ncbi:MAG: glutamate racemase [Nitrospirota bacterium]
MRGLSPIGIFDSGIGGLTVLKEIKRNLPEEDIVYLGDTARVPYGIRSPETITRYSFEAAAFLMKLNIKMLVVACNTSSAISLNALKRSVSVPVIGVIEPGARAAVNASKTRRIGVIGTEATISSGAYARAIKKISQRAEIVAAACPLFVPLVEEGWFDNEITRLTAELYLSPLKKDNIDTLVLGCTHYPLLKDVIGNIMGDSVSLIDSAIETALQVKDVLKEGGIFKKYISVTPSYEYYVTDSPERFKRIGEMFLGEELKQVKKIDICRRENNAY